MKTILNRVLYLLLCVAVPDTTLGKLLSFIGLIVLATSLVVFLATGSLRR
jgi:hypothetical protein